MIVLAADTTARSCSVALVADGHLRAETTLDRSETHAKHLHGLIGSLLNTVGMHLNDVDGFAVAKGPGSFTGLRIGMSTIKGLAFAARRPMVGVSSLEALAHQAGCISIQICPMIDARRQQVYAADYRSVDGRMALHGSERVAAPQDVLAQISAPCVFIGSGALTYQRLINDILGTAAVVPPTANHIIRAATIAHLAVPRFEPFDVDSLSACGPNYIRPSDAEMNR